MLCETLPKYKAKNGKFRVRLREGRDDIAMGKQRCVPGLGHIRGVKQDYRISRVLRPARVNYDTITK